MSELTRLPATRKPLSDVRPETWNGRRSRTRDVQLVKLQFVCKYKTYAPMDDRPDHLYPWKPSELFDRPAY
jgi:hypothetical protein